MKMLSSCRTAGRLLNIGLLLSILVGFSSMAMASAPVVISLNPWGGPIGSYVTILGSGLGATQGSSTVSFDGTPATWVYWSSTQIIAQVPVGATTGNVVVTVGGVSSNAKIFYISAAPAITSISPTSGSLGKTVTVTGTNFTGGGWSSPYLYFNPTVQATITSASDTTIVATVPNGATTGNLEVQVAGALFNGPSFTVTSPGPSISSVSPQGGVTGASITISGSGFGSTQGASTVTFNSTLGSPTSWTSTSIVVPVPSGATAGNIVVTVGGVASNPYAFNAGVAAPSITSVSPTSGQAGNPVTINGTSFGSTQGSSLVAFNGATAVPTSWSATKIVTKVPTFATTGSIVVSAGGGMSNGVNFTVTPTVNITSVLPLAGGIGTPIRITGNNFGSSQGSSTVTFNGTVAVPTNWTASSIDVPVPAGATTGSVIVTVNGVASNGITFTVTGAPSITSISPNAGGIGASITLSGNNFGATKGTSSVTFNGTKATPTSWSSSTIVVPVPTGATTGPVEVIVGGVTSNGVPFTLSSAPLITTISPLSGKAGTSVTINGSGFGASQGTSTVTFNGTAASPTSWAATKIIVPAPTGVTTGDVTVTVGGLASNGVQFVASPVISSLSPTSGAVTAPVTITGTNFGTSPASSTVTFNGTTASPTSWANTSIVVPVPSGATTGAVVVTVGGVSSNTKTFTVTSPPSITGISPSSGAVTSPVTVTGASFGSSKGTSTVTFNGAAATTTSWSATQIVATVPSAATSGNVVVTVSGVASNGVSFTVVPTPNIVAVSPTVGAPGALVAITGTNFGATQGSSVVAFNGTSATPTSWSSTQILVPVPVAATTGKIVVTVGGVPSNGVSFTVSSSPTITNLSPNSGAVGAVVTVTGGNFGSTQGSSTVTFAGTAGTPTSWSATQIVVSVPAGAATGNVVVKVNGVASKGVSFTVLGTPNITSLSPTSGGSGAPVTINGTSFGSSQGTSTVTFNGMAASPTSWSNTKIVTTVPAGAGSGNVVVTVAGVPSNGVSFTVLPTPNISSLSPTSGSVGTVVTILGGNFGASQGTSTVTFNGTAGTPTSWTSGQIVMPVPSGATTGNVVVTVNGVASNGASFTVYATPSITSLSPTSGNQGSPVTITGTNFGSSQGASTVTFNGVTATTTSWSTTQIKTTVPIGASTGTVVVTVNGVPSNGVSFTVTGGPTVTSLSPTSGGVGTPVTIKGTNFGPSQGSSTVAFNGVTATSSSWSSTQIIVTVPNGATTGNVIVTVNGQSSTGGSGSIFTVPTPPPSITSLSFTQGPAQMGVVINGANFTSFPGNVTIAGSNVPLSDILSWGPTSITMQVPVGTPQGQTSINVTVNSMTSNPAPFNVTNYIQCSLPTQ